MPPILDVAIGLLFVYLLFSLIVSAAKEIISGFVFSSSDGRAKLLQEGLNELFRSPQGDGFGKLFNEHPLIQALSPARDGSLPNYIPRETFASTVLDLVAPAKADAARKPEDVIEGILKLCGGGGFATKAESLLRDLRTHMPTDQDVLTSIGLLDLVVDGIGRGGVNSHTTTFQAKIDAIKATLKQQFDSDPDLSAKRQTVESAKIAFEATPADESLKTALETAQTELTKAETAHALTRFSPSLDDLKAPIPQLGQVGAALPGGKELQQTLLSLYEDAGRDLAKFKEHIGAWFDCSMDRVTGWYKKYSQGILLVIALGFAIGCNVDTLQIVDALSTDPKLRDAIVSSATKYVSKSSQASSRKLADAEARLAKATEDANNETDATKKPAANKVVEELKKDAKDAWDAWTVEVSKAEAAVANADKEATSAKKDAIQAKDAERAAKDANAKEEAKKASEKADTRAKILEKLVTEKKEELEAVKSEGTTDATAKLKNAVREMNGFGLPVGWHDGEWKKTWQDFPSSLRAILGWLLTALAASLGAPFWFDTLNKIVTIRAGGRAPEEKNPGENGGASKKGDAERKS